MPMPRLHLSLLLTLSWITGLLPTVLGPWRLGPTPAQAQVSAFCQLPPQAAAQKEALLKATVQGNPTAKAQYQTLVAQDAQRLQLCRARAWPRTQAIWLRLHDCDLEPGVLDGLMDRLVNQGYNQVYIEVFYHGRVLLPAAEIPSPWAPVIRRQQYANRDLLAEAIQKARQRGLKAYAWLFSLNFGPAYGARADRSAALARNRRPPTTSDARGGDLGKAFVDPYNPQVIQDYNRLVQAVLKRQPDGVLFDYIRYPREPGTGSIVTQSRDLWIFGQASQQAMVNRALNQKGRLLIQRYLETGTLTLKDLATADGLYPKEKAALWQGRKPPAFSSPATVRLSRLKWDLWLLSVAHAYQGIVNFLTFAVTPVQQQRLATGAVFFPGANRKVGQGYDARMQPWHRFPPNIEWHAMSYGICGDTSCIVDKVKRVVAQAPQGTRISPVIAGAWGQPLRNRPSLEAQMLAIRQVAPQIQSISHFDFSWQDPIFSNARRACTVRYTQ